jgi:hypothetical protein
MAIAYFLAARMGLGLPSARPDVGPASGLAVCILIISGRRVYASLIIGVVIGTIAGDLLNDRIEGIKGA